jgi:hypothetical protein
MEATLKASAKSEQPSLLSIKGLIAFDAGPPLQ